MLKSTLWLCPSYSYSSFTFLLWFIHSCIIRIILICIFIVFFNRQVLIISLQYLINRITEFWNATKLYFFLCWSDIIVSYALLDIWRRALLTVCLHPSSCFLLEELLLLHELCLYPCFRQNLVFFLMGHRVIAKQVF